jgi:hypothetical protein
MLSKGEKQLVMAFLPRWIQIEVVAALFVPPRHVHPDLILL